MNKRVVIGFGALAMACAVVGALVAAQDRGHRTVETKTEASPGVWQLGALLLGPEDIGLDVILASLTLESDPRVQHQLRWQGQSQLERRTASSTIRVTARLVPATEDVVECAQQALRSASIPIPEDTGAGSPCRLLGDRVWHSGGRLVFVKGHVVGDVHACVSDDTANRTEVVHRVAQALSRKVHALTAGVPEPVPVLPFLSSVRKEEWGTKEEQGLEWAWAVKKLQESWGEQGTTLMFTDRNGLPRDIPAKKLGEKVYLVLLGHIVNLLDPQGSVAPHLAGATIHGPRPNYHEVTVLGKQMRVTHGEANLAVEGKAVQLDRPVQVERGFTFVPLSSFAEKAVGVKVEYSKHSDLPKITLTPAGAVGK